MTVYHVTRILTTDTIGGEVRVWRTHNHITHVEPGGPCHTPVRLAVAGRVVVLPCWRRLPADSRCPACRVVLHVTEVATTHRTPDSPSGTARSGGA